MPTETQTNIKHLTTLLKAAQGEKLKMLIGVDGFVDVIFHVVAKRTDAEHYTRMETIEEFGKRVLNAAGLSTNFELITINTKLGGNGPILANALLEYGVKLTYAGAIGYPDIHPVFRAMAEKSENVYALCDPSRTDAYEFGDGKLMMGKHSEMKKITWERFKEVLGGTEAIAALVSESDLLGMENWTMVMQMSAIWKGLIQEVFPLLPDKPVKPLAFFDLADPEKRAKADILEALSLIGRFEQKFRVVLGLNEKELYEIAAVLGIPVPNALADEARLRFTVAHVYKKLSVYCLVAHPTREAACCIDGKYFHTSGPYCPNPAITIGAGDNFNAGFCFGLALGLDAQSALTLGVATSGFYVRHAKSPTLTEQLAFLEQWADGNI